MCFSALLPFASSSVEEGGAVKMGRVAGFRFRNPKKIRQGPLWLFRPDGIECNPQQSRFSSSEEVHSCIIKHAGSPHWL